MPIPRCPSSAPRGFSLIEAVVVVAVLAIIAGMSLAALGGLKQKTVFNNLAVELSADLTAARQRALAEQRPVWVVLLRSTTNSALPDRYTVILDGDSNFNVSTYDANAAVAAPDQLLADRTLALPARFGPPAGFGPFPSGSPFASVPTNLPVTFAATGFSGTYDARASLTFQPDGTVSLLGGAATGSISFYDPTNGRKQAIAVVGPTASFRVY